GGGFSSGGGRGFPGGGFPGGGFSSGGGRGFPGGGFSFSSGGVNADDIFNSEFGGADINEILRGFMGGAGGRSGGGSPFGGGFDGHASHKRSKDSIHRVPLTLEQLYNGALLTVKVSKQIADAGGYMPVQKDYELDIKPGYKAGMKIRYPNEGDEQPGSQAGDLVFVLEEKHHGLFKRSGDDLHYDVTISLRQALTGCALTIPALDSRPIRLELRNIISPGHVEKVAGEGMPSHKTPGRKGDLLVHFHIQFPQSLSQEQKALIKQAL
ncbi:MAG: J domain-containing protein, partial [archaeon]|nr:J domain-containing protein [archaeon]